MPLDLTRRYFERHPRRAVFISAISLRVVVLVLLQLCLYLQGAPFDSSHLLVESPGHKSPAPHTLRWDALHFQSIARKGYEYEQQLAFQPGWPLLMRYTALGWRLLCGDGSGLVFARSEDLGASDIERVGQVLASLSYAGAAMVLYSLTVRLLGPRRARTTTFFYLLPAAPAILSSPYSEPLFALLVFTGYNLCIGHRFVLASICLAGATSIRATGVVNVGVLAWYGIFRTGSPVAVFRTPKILIRRALQITFPALLTVLPFAITQLHWYEQFCTGTAQIVGGRPLWCDKRVPLIYSHVQEKYWNVGLLNYWTLAQVPNLAIAAPILGVSLYGSYRFFSPFFWKSRAHLAPDGATSDGPTWSILPFYITHLALTLLLTFSAHSQIALRVSVTDPVIWWTVADLAVWPSQAASATVSARKLTGFGKAWIWWSVVFGAISIPLWAGHYPPA